MMIAGCYNDRLLRQLVATTTSCCDDVISLVLFGEAFLEKSILYKVFISPYLAAKVSVECLMTLHSVMTSDN